MKSRRKKLKYFNNYKLPGDLNTVKGGLAYVPTIIPNPTPSANAIIEDSPLAHEL